MIDGPFKSIGISAVENNGGNKIIFEGAPVPEFSCTQTRYLPGKTNTQMPVLDRSRGRGGRPPSVLAR